MAWGLLNRRREIEHLAFHFGEREFDSRCHMFSTCVRMTIEWVMPVGQTRPVTMALHSVAADTRTTRGCVGCSVSTDIGNRGTVRYSEEWLTEEDLRERVRSDSFDQLVTLIEGATHPPRIEFTLAHQTRGLDFVEEIRASTT
jgi:quinol monooxygenase YgiN